jgi:hypothetical protein
MYLSDFCRFLLCTCEWERRGERRAEVEFLEEIQTEVLRVFLLAIHRHLYKQIVLPAPSVFLDLRFLQLCLVISTATAGGMSGLISTWINEE